MSANAFAADDLQHWVDVIKHCKAKKKELEDMEERAWAELLEAAPKDVDLITVADKPVFEIRRQTQSRVNMRRLREELPSLVEGYTEETVRVTKHLITEE
ncbi:hypothetical protein [Nocardia nova]|uniref:hypothetical protein n=1 Tax=Nocardia nova TaxID=37330 RepID=UPI002739464E|nr:hypothetical protein [Nocardia nova]